MTRPSSPAEKRFYVLFVLVLVTLGPWCLLAFTSLFAFDAPGSGKNPGIWCVVLPIWCYPIFAGIAAVVGFVLKRMGLLRGAQLALAVPLVAATLFVTAGIGLVAYELIHDARTSTYADYSGKGLTELPAKLFKREVPVESLNLSGNRLAVLPPEIGRLT